MSGMKGGPGLVQRPSLNITGQQAVEAIQKPFGKGLWALKVRPLGSGMHPCIGAARAYKLHGLA